MTLSKIQHEKIDPKNPWLRDKLERKKVADYLTPVLASIRQPFVISLHSPYGTGKSFFLECWKADLEAQGYTVVLFDAWKTDFSNDPLSAFIASLKKQTETEGAAIRKRWQDLAKRSGGFLRDRAMSLLLKGAARRALGEEGLTEMLNHLNLENNEVAEMLSSMALEALNTQEAAEKSMKYFRDGLSDTAQAVVKAKNWSGTIAPRHDNGQEKTPEEIVIERERELENRRKLIILVDELDRCKPSYAIDVLERIKHLFAVEGTVFVLAFDETQMLEAIARTYGLKHSGEDYLRKFIDWRFEMPEPRVAHYCSFLADALFSGTVPKSESDVADGIQCAAMVKKLSLRQIEQAFSYANLVLRSKDSSMLKHFPYAFGVFSGLFAWCQSYMKEMVGDLSLAAKFIEEAAELALRGDSSLPGRHLFRDNAFLMFFLNEEMVHNIDIFMNEQEPKSTKLSKNEQLVFDADSEHAYFGFARITSDAFFCGFETESVAQLSFRLLSGASQYLR